MLVLGIPNELYTSGSPLFGLFSLTPLYIAVSKSKSYRMTFWLCFLHGAAVHLLSSFWLKNFGDQAIFTLGASLLGTACIEGVVSIILFYPFSNLNAIRQDSILSPYEVPVKIFWFTAFYVLYEFIKSTGFLGYPWGVISMTAYRWHLFTQIADIAGRWGISFVFVLISALTGQGILMLTQKRDTYSSSKKLFAYNSAFRFTVSLFILCFAYGTYEYAKPRTAIKKVNTVMVQQDIQTFRTNEMDGIQTSENLTDLGIDQFRSNGQKPDLIVWSEGVLNKYFPNSMNYYEIFPESKPFLAFVREKKIPFIAGGALTIDSERHKYGNAAVLISKNGNYQGSYVKLHLVPFAEIIPFVDCEPVRKFIKKIAGFSYGWTPGKKYVLFEIPVNPENCIDTGGLEIISSDKKTAAKKPTVLISTPICYDDAFTHVCRGLFLSGSELFMNLTNDSWSNTSSSEMQHFVIASYRAIEYRTTLARCTNAGVTAIVDPAGRTLASLPLFEEDQLSYSIPVYKRQMTVYARFGDWLPLILGLSVLSYMAFFEYLRRHENIVTEISTELVKRRRSTSRRKSFAPAETSAENK